MLTRRRLVQAGGAATAALYLSGVPAPAVAAGVPAHLRRSSYDALVGEAFAAAGLTLTLLEAAGSEDVFALTFSGAPGLASGTHELRNDALGSFALLLGPIGPAGGEQLYEVVVDRSVRLAEAAEAAPEPMALSNAPAAADPAPAPGPARKPKRRPRLVQAATVAWRGGALTADIRVARGHGIVSVRAKLVRDGVEYARAGRLLRRKHGIRLVLRRLRPVGPGVYVLHVTTNDVHGRRVTSRRRVTLG